MDDTAQWYEVIVGTQEFATSAMTTMLLSIERAFDSVGRPKDAAVFTSELVFTNAPDDQGAVFIYFSPDAARCCGDIIRAHSDR